MTRNAVSDCPSQSTLPSPTLTRSSFTMPSRGADWNSFWKSSAIATVGTTTGKKISVRRSTEERLSTKM
jgi:hypothetical protein